MMCCLSGARVQDVLGELQNILEGQAEWLDVVVHVDRNYIGCKREEVLQSEYGELDKILRFLGVLRFSNIHFQCHVVVMVGIER